MSHQSLRPWPLVCVLGLTTLACRSTGAGPAGDEMSGEDDTSEGGAGGGAAQEAGRGGSAGGGASGSGAAGTGGSKDPGGDGDPACWSLPTVTRARIWPRTGQGARMVGGRLEGSTESATNGFVEIAKISAAPADGTWTEIPIANAKAWRYVKYYSPAGSYGVVAELELYDQERKLTGKGFGTAGARSGSSSFDKALDGKPETFFEGPLADDNYVGLDLGDGHEAAAPTPSLPGGRHASGTKVSLTSATEGAVIKFTTDGSDPRAGATYAGPIALADGATTLKAVASKACFLDSAVTTDVYRVGATAPAGSATSLHIGNSLTDTIDGFLEPVAKSGGVTLAFNRYTIPGAGVGFLWDRPTGGFGVANVREALSTKSFDHLSFQPFPNGPCTPDAEVTATMNFYSLQQKVNPNVRVWIYQQWPTPDYKDCLSQGAGWAKPPWNPPKAPTSWEDAVMNQLAYQESVRAKMEAKMPAGSPKPGIIPAGLALLELKRAIEAGKVPGMTSFFPSIYTKGGTDFHLSDPGRYFVAALFYACMFEQDPRGVLTLPRANLSAAQNAAFLEVVWKTASTYALCMP